MKKQELIDRVFATAQADSGFLFNDCRGTDLLMDALTEHLDNMTKKDLIKLHEKAKQSQWYKETM